MSTMNLTINLNGITYKVLFDKAHCIAIPMIFNGNQPNTYNVDAAVSSPYRDDQFVGDVTQGGPCNFESYSLIPHCNGTHTECIGHLSYERIDVQSTLEDSLIPCTLISVTPVKANETSETYSPPLEAADKVITKSALEKALDPFQPKLHKAIAIRTLPNNIGKKSKKYMDDLPSFFSNEAMKYLVSLGVDHLLVDMPSVDRTFDNGVLSNHRIFWHLKPGETHVDVKNPSKKTITEMIFVEDEVSDGIYLLNLQMAAFVGDASPSRPLLYKLIEL